MMNMAAERLFQARAYRHRLKHEQYLPDLREANRIRREWTDLRRKVEAHRAAVRSVRAQPKQTAPRGIEIAAAGPRDLVTRGAEA